ncbi:MAG: aldo/keto reductase [Anaerolineae bacterium]|nr:aldo/keto reductase [Anaerolineae bacterium]
MNYVEFGSTGKKISEMSLGTMMFGVRCDKPESDRILGMTMDHGINSIDTAAMYGNGLTEEILGQIIKGRRDKLFIGTKVHKGVDTRSILESIDESLTRLQTDYVDLYMIHWPVVGMNPEEIMAALNTVVTQGKARYVGCCNYPAWLLAHSNAIAQQNGWPKLVCNQVAYNLIERGVEVEILPQAVAEKVAITTYRSLAQGLLTGKYRHGQPLPDNSRGESSTQIITWLSQHGEAVEHYLRLAERRGVHPVELALAWVRYSAGVTSPIVGVSSLGQLQTSIDAFDFNLTADEYDELTFLFDTDVKEEGLQRFPGLKYNFPRLRRNLGLLGG